MNKRVYIVLFAIMIILIVGVSASILYNKFNDKDDSKENNKNPIVDIDEYTKIAIFPESDDTIKTSITLDYHNKCQNKENCKIINSSKNFKDEKFTGTDITVETSCDIFIDDENEPYCDTSIVKIDNKINYSTFIGYEPGKNRIRIIKTSEFYIVEDIEGGYQNGTVTIYDKNGEEIKTIENTVTLFLQGKDIEDTKRYEGFEIALKENIMYYATTDNYRDYIKDQEKYDKENLCKNYVHFYYMDLVTLKVTEISKTCAYTSEMLPT